MDVKLHAFYVNQFHKFYLKKYVNYQKSLNEVKDEMHMKKTYLLCKINVN